MSHFPGSVWTTCLKNCQFSKIGVNSAGQEIEPVLMGVGKGGHGLLPGFSHSLKPPKIQKIRPFLVVNTCFILIGPT